MKTIISMLVATILALYTFCTSCWYAPPVIFDSVHAISLLRSPAYLLTAYFVYRYRHRV